MTGGKIASWGPRWNRKGHRFRQRWRPLSSVLLRTKSLRAWWCRLPFSNVNYETPFGWTMREIEKIRWNFLRTPHGSSSCPVTGRARPVHSSTRLEITISHTILDAGRGHRWFFFTTLFRFLFFRVYYHQWKKETNRGSWASSQIVVEDIVAKVTSIDLLPHAVTCTYFQHCTVILLCNLSSFPCSHILAIQSVNYFSFSSIFV